MDVAITAFLVGLLATTSPCVLPLYPGFLAYLSGQTGSRSARRTALLGPVVLLGVLTMMLALGALIAALAISVGSASAVVVPLADATLLVVGVLLVLGRNPFRALPQVRVPVLREPLINAYVYGLLYGPIALPCSGPLAVAIFALSLSIDDAAGKLWVFLWFGLGLGVPLLVLSLLSAAFQRRLTRALAGRGRLIEAVGGVLLIGVAIFDVAQNWSMLAAFYG